MKEIKSQRNLDNANDALRMHNCSDNYYQHLFGIVYTDGAKALADEFQCYWFLIIIVSYQPLLKQHEFQVWTLLGDDDTEYAVVMLRTVSSSGQSLLASLTHMALFTQNFLAS